MMYRVKNSKYSMLGGVCAGISHRTNIALWVVRLAVLICFVLQPLLILLYIALWAFLPIKHMSDQEFKAETVTFRDIPSVKGEVQMIEEDLSINNSPKVKTKNVFKNIEDSIAKNIEARQQK